MAREDETSAREEELTVHMWDFAGQEITYATHQFFLTRRSVYALVVDSRRDNPNFDYWLNVVEMLSDKSPLVIVKNEKGDNQCLIDEGGARAKFGNIRDVVSVNLLSNRGLEGAVRVARTARIAAGALAARSDALDENRALGRRSLLAELRILCIAESPFELEICQNVFLLTVAIEAGRSQMTQ